MERKAQASKFIRRLSNRVATLNRDRASFEKEGARVEAMIAETKMRRAQIQFQRNIGWDFR